MLYPGDTFTMEVRSRFKVYLHSAEIQIKLGVGLSIKNIDVKSGVFEQDKIDQNSAKTVAYVVMVTRKDGANFKSTILAPTMVSTMQTRADVVDTTTPKGSAEADTKTAGVVHFGSDSVAGMFAYVSPNKPTELVNMAVLSGKAISTAIVVKSVSMRGVLATVATKDQTCKSSDADVIQSSSACAVALQGKETKGSAKVTVGVTALGHKRDVPFRVHIVDPQSVKIESSLTTLRPIAGWYDSSDQSCKRLKYQTGVVTVTASFTDGTSDKLPALDVSQHANIVSSDTKLVAVTSEATGVTITGLAGGSVELSVKPANSFTFGKAAKLGVTTLGQTDGRWDDCRCWDRRGARCLPGEHRPQANIAV